MVELYVPEMKDLWFRQKMLKDGRTMAFNHAYGGTVDFSEAKWAAWYSRWIEGNAGRRFYWYLLEKETNEFVGEAAYYLEDDRWNVSIIIFDQCRNKGYGTRALELLCREAEKNGIDYLYDSIAIDNPSVRLFLKNGFEEECRSEEMIRVKKKL